MVLGIAPLVFVFFTFITTVTVAFHNRTVAIDECRDDGYDTTTDASNDEKAPEREFSDETRNLMHDCLLLSLGHDRSSSIGNSLTLLALALLALGSLGCLLLQRDTALVLLRA